MKTMIRNQKGQTGIEYALICIVLLAIVTVAVAPTAFMALADVVSSGPQSTDETLAAITVALAPRVTASCAIRYP